jgi:hypothetical protein
MRPLVIVIAASLLLVVTKGQADDVIYKWTDDGGSVHYTQIPPKEREYERMKGSAPPSSDPEETLQNLQEQVAKLEKQRESTEEEDLDKQREILNAKIRKDNCKIARNNLQNLEMAGGRRYMIDGEVIRLTEEERQKRLTEANEQIAEYCDPA